MRTDRPSCPPLPAIALVAATCGLLPLASSTGPPLRAQTAQSGEEKEPGAREQLHADPALTGVLSVIERAFRHCDAGALRPVFSRRLKTYVGTRALANAEGYYGADQMILLFQRLFEGKTTTRFTALTPHLRPRADGQAVFPALWVSRGGGSSRIERRFSFVLAPEETVWRIREIRDLK